MEVTISEKTERLISEMKSMRRSQQSGRLKPHKPVMLLTVLDLMQRGEINTNRVVFNQSLCDRFEVLFSAVRQEEDWCQPSAPYFHLRTSGFWFHKPRKGREKACVELDTAGGGSKRITDNIEYAFFDPDSYEVLSKSDGRQDVFEAILSFFFTQHESDRVRSLTYFSGH